MTEEAVHPIVRGFTPVRQFNHLGKVTAVAVFPDRRRMATNSSDGMVHLWDLKSGVMMMELEGRGAPMRDMALSRDGKLIASSDVEGYVTAWDGDTGRLLAQPFLVHSGRDSTCFLDFSPDGARLATGSSGVITLWNTETWKKQGRSPGYDSNSPTCVRYSSSGELLAVASSYHVHIWKIAAPTASAIRTIATFDQSPISLVWLPDDTRLLGGTASDTAIRVWDSSTWKQVSDIWKGEIGNYSCQWRFAINYNGTIVASPTTNNRVRLWRLSDRRTIAIFQHSDFPCCVTFSMDGKHILAGGTDRKISEWTVPECAWPEDTSQDQAIYKAEDSNPETQDSNTKVEGSDGEAQDLESKILTMNATVRNACISGNLPIAEELLTQEIDASGDNYRSYANRSVVMARRLDWDHALDDAVKGIALCGKKQVQDAKRAFDLASIFADGDPKINP